MQAVASKGIYMPNPRCVFLERLIDKLELFQQHCTAVFLKCTQRKRHFSLEPEKVALDMMQSIQHVLSYAW